MNSNLFHNIANVATLVLAAATAALVASGCAQNAAGALDCGKSWIDPTYATVAIAGIQALKLAVNVARDGLGGLAKPQPPVKQ